MTCPFRVYRGKYGYMDFFYFSPIFCDKMGLFRNIFPNFFIFFANQTINIFV